MTIVIIKITPKILINSSPDILKRSKLRLSYNRIRKFREKGKSFKFYESLPSVECNILQYNEKYTNNTIEGTDKIINNKR